MASDRSQPQLLKRIESARRVVSLCSQETIRAYDEEALLAFTCRNLVDVGNYSMAWFGETIDGSNALQPLAHAGVTGDSGVRDVNPPWMQDLGRRSPTLRATMEQRPQVIRGLPASIPDKADRESAREGIGALCAFPIQFGPHGSGALTIYAREPDAFAPEEVALMRELAGDIAIGVAGLRARQANDRLELLLEASERRARGLIEQAPVGIVQFDIEGNVLIANKALAKLLGYESADQITSQSREELARHLDDDDLQKILRDIASGPPYKTFNFEAYRTDRTRAGVQVELRNGNGDAEPVIEAFVRDMTEARAAILAASHLAAVVDSADEAIIGITRHGNVTTWSHGATRLYGFAEAETVGRPLKDFNIPEDRHGEWKAMLASLARGQPVARFDTKRLCKGKEVKDVTMAASPISDADGKIVAASITAHDISDRIRAEAFRMARARQEDEVAKWKQLDHLRSDFMNRASHELNTPLTPVLLQVQALRDSPGLDARQRSSLTLIERNVTRLAKLVKGLTTASKLTSSSLEMNPAQLDMRELVEQAIQTHAAQASTGNVTLRANDTGPMAAYADPERLMQVLFNLFGNALKYTQSGGTVDVVSKEHEGFFHLTITDSGLGFPDDKRPLLFSPFGRLHEDVAGAPAGSGLGLFISKGIVEGSGGQMWAESPGVGKGATFGFTLPVRPMERPGRGIRSATRPGRTPERDAAKDPLEQRAAAPVANPES